MVGRLWVMKLMNANGRRAAGLMLCGLLLLICFGASLLLGTVNYGWHTGWAALVHYDESISEQVIIRTTRLPRACIAAVIGASLAIAGALMQALTRNPLASPSMLGINAGATFLVVLAAVAFSIDSMQSLMWISFLGASVGAVLVYILGSMGRDGLSPLTIVLAGAAMTALFASFTQGILVLNKQGLSTVLFWLTGTIAGRSPDMLMAVLPYMLVSWAGAWLISKEMNLLMMGEDTAKVLGQRMLAVKAAVGMIVVVLAGGSVSVAGPIGFIGIVIPHISRFFAGLDHRWLIPYCALLGAILLLLADLLARFIMIPEEMPVGVMTAIIGAPFFMYIARRGIVKS